MKQRGLNLPDETGAGDAGNGRLPAAKPRTAVRVVAGERDGGPRGGRGINLLEVLWNRRIALIVCVATALGVGGVYLYRAIPVYQSVSQVYIERQGPRIMSSDDMSMSMSQGLAAQVEIMRSTALLDAAAKLPAMKQTSFAANKDVSPVGYLKGGLEVSPASSGDMLFVSFKSPDPADNAIIVNSVVEAFIDYHNLKRRSTAAEVLKILREEKQRLEVEFENTNRDILKFKQDNQALTFDDSSLNPEVLRLQRLTAALTEAELAMTSTRIAFEAADAVRNDPEALDAVLQQARLLGDPAAAMSETADEQRAAQLRERLAVLKDTYGELHPMVSQLQFQLKVIEAGRGGPAADPSTRYFKTLDARFQDAMATQTALRNEVDAQLAKVMRQDVNSTEFLMLQNAAQRLDRQIDLIDTRIKELNVTEDTGVLTISILEPAVATSDPIAPNHSQILAISVVMGLLVGVGGAFLLEWVDDRVRSADDLTEALGLNVLGLVPRIKGKKELSNAAMLVHHHPRSNVAEAYRTIRTALHFGTMRTGGRIILITSPQPGDGKSTVTGNLGISFAQTASKTLIIDADCRKPRQHRIHGVDKGAGLAGVLSGEVMLEDAIRVTDVPNLHVLPCGPVPANPSEMLNTGAFEELLEEVSEQYEWVLVDSAPVVAVADARVIAAVADATVLVVRADTSRRRVIEAAIDALESVGARVVGAVVNAVSQSRGGYGSYGRYGYYSYGYGANGTNSGVLESSRVLDHDFAAPAHPSQVEP